MRELCGLSTALAHACWAAHVEAGLVDGGGTGGAEIGGRWARGEVGVLGAGVIEGEEAAHRFST